MNVIQDDHGAKHLLQWANAQAKILTLSSPFYTLQTLLHSGFLLRMLASIDETFGSLEEERDSPAEILAHLEKFLNKQCGKRVKLSFKNKIAKQNSIQALSSLSFYACLHSKKKSDFIDRILSLSEEAQTGLMEMIQEINSSTEDISDVKGILVRVEQLQMQAENLKRQLNISSSRQQVHNMTICELQCQLKQSMKDLKQIKDEKQNVIEALKLSSFEEYLSTFQKLQQENKILNNYVQDLEESNQNYEMHSNEMKDRIKNQLAVISDLNDEITSLKDKYNMLKMDKLFPTPPEDTLDASRSFGHDLTNNARQNLDISYIQKKARAPRFSNMSDWWLGDEEAEGENLTNGVELQGQVEQLRKYNQQLMHKLDSVYKTVNSLTTEASELREKNRVVKKENRFYKRQLDEMRKLHAKFERKYLAGEF